MANDNSDLSPRVVQLARIIDRLPAGSFDIHLMKPEDKTSGWKIEVVQPVILREVVLNKPQIHIDITPNTEIVV